MTRHLDSNDVRSRLGFLPDPVPAAIVKGDTNGDSYDDIVAVFVDRTSSVAKSSVAVFHGRLAGYSEAPVWVVRDSLDSIAGIAIPESPGVTLIVCYECDDIPVYYWSGDGYELDIRLPGDIVSLSSEASIYAAQDTTSSLVFKVTDTFGYARILQLGQKTEKETRWYKVRITSSNGEPTQPEISGFVDSSWFLVEN